DGGNDALGFGNIAQVVALHVNDDQRGFRRVEMIEHMQPPPLLHDAINQIGGQAVRGWFIHVVSVSLSVELICVAAHSAWILARFTTSAQRRLSFSMKSANCAGSLATTSTPWSAKRWRTSG